MVAVFCPNCGKDCGEANFCSGCGRRLVNTAPTGSYAERKRALQASGQVYCPKCLSTSVTVKEQRNPYIHSPFGGLFWLIRDHLNKKSLSAYGTRAICIQCGNEWYPKCHAMHAKHAAYLRRVFKKSFPIKILGPNDMYILLNEEGIEISSYYSRNTDKVWVATYESLTAVEHRSGIGPLDGHLSIRSTDHKRSFPKTLNAARKDIYTAFYYNGYEEHVRTLYAALKVIIKENKEAGLV